MAVASTSLVWTIFSCQRKPRSHWRCFLPMTFRIQVCESCEYVQQEIFIQKHPNPQANRRDDGWSSCFVCQSEGFDGHSLCKKVWHISVAQRYSLCMQNCLREDTTAVPFGEKEWGFAIDNMIFVMLVLLIWLLEFFLVSFFRHTDCNLWFVSELSFSWNTICIHTPTIPGLCFVLIVNFISLTGHMFHPRNYHKLPTLASRLNKIVQHSNVHISLLDFQVGNGRNCKKIVKQWVMGSWNLDAPAVFCRLYSTAST